jgi:uncharacterized membrane protein
MEIRFRNSYPSTVWIAVMFYSPDGCRDDGSWGTRGWWRLATGETKHPLNTDNRYAAFYAEAEDGAFWAGPYGPVYVYQEAFDSCVGIGSTAAIDIVGMRLIDTNGSDLTLNLTP